MQLIKTCLVLLLLVPTYTLNAEPLDLSNDATMKSVLIAQQDKRITLNLTSGKELSGTVGLVTDSVVHIKQLSGKEFFDAVIAIKKIEAVQIRTRK